MILVDQHFRECSFCGRSFPPQWQPLTHHGRLYCSEKCIRFEEVFPEVSDRGAAEPGREEGKHGRSSGN
jgi:hypothetical protein